MPKVRRSRLNQLPDPAQAEREARERGIEIIEDLQTASTPNLPSGSFQGPLAPPSAPFGRHETMAQVEQRYYNTTPIYQMASDFGNAFADVGQQYGPDLAALATPMATTGMGIKAMAATQLGRTSPAAGRLIGGYLGNLIGEGANYGIAKLTGRKDLTPSMGGAQLRSVLSGAIPGASTLIGEILGTASNVSEATLKATAAKAAETPFTGRAARELTKKIGPREELEMGRKMSAQARLSRGSISPEMGARTALFDDLAQKGVKVKVDDLADLINDYADNFPSSLKSNQNASAQMKDLADYLIQNEADVNGLMDYSRLRELLSEWQEAAFAKDTQSGFAKALRSIQHDVHEHALGTLSQQSPQAAAAWQTYDAAISQRMQAIKDFEKTFLGKSPSPALRANKAEGVVRGYLQAKEGVKNIVKALDAAEGTTFDRDLTNLAMKREWNPLDTTRAKELYVQLFRATQRFPLLNALGGAKAAIQLSAPLGPLTSLAGQFIAHPTLSKPEKIPFGE